MGEAYQEQTVFKSESYAAEQANSTGRTLSSLDFLLGEAK